MEIRYFKSERWEIKCWKCSSDCFHNAIRTNSINSKYMYASAYVSGSVFANVYVGVWE